MSHFNIVSRPRGRVLVLDCEAFGYGVLSLSRELAVEIPFLVLNTLKLYLDAGKPLAMGGFRQKHFPVACLSDFATDDKNQPLIHVAKIEPDGFTMTGRHVRREIFKLARRI